MDCRRVDLWKRETGKRLEKEVSAAEEKEWARCWNNGTALRRSGPAGKNSPVRKVWRTV